ncbi:MAG: hypothetical protein ACI37Z_00690 [Candidatus Gastranaerophilaceae bacterium]
MKKFLIVILMLICSMGQGFAVEADDSIDAIIEKTYGADSTLPKLPKTSPKSVKSDVIFQTGGKESSVPSTVSVPASSTKPQNSSKSFESIPKIPQKINVRTSKVGRWKKFNVKFNNNISDGSRAGAKVSFTTKAPIVTKKFILPTGTIIYGTVVNSHSPQMLGNGGLLSIKADYIQYNGKTSYCEGNIVSVNHRLVLFNNIKGNNGYVKGVKKVVKPAKTFYNKSVKVSKKLWNSPGFILAPITYLPGAVFLAGDVIVSPIGGLFHKGDRVYIPKGTDAVIKLTSPAYIEY